MITILIAGIVFLCSRPSCWCIFPSIMCLLLSAVFSLLQRSPPVENLIDQLIKLFWYWKLGYLGLCFYMTIHPINASFPTARPSYQYDCPVLLMHLFISVNDPLLSMLFSAKYVRPLIYYNIDIDSWDWRDCVLSVIGTVHHVDVYFPYVVSILHLCQCPLMSTIPSIDRFLYR